MWAIACNIDNGCRRRIQEGNTLWKNVGLVILGNLINTGLFVYPIYVYTYGSLVGFYYICILSLFFFFLWGLTLKSLGSTWKTLVSLFSLFGILMFLKCLSFVYLEIDSDPILGPLYSSMLGYQGPFLMIYHNSMWAATIQFTYWQYICGFLLFAIPSIFMGLGLTFKTYVLKKRSQ